MSLLEVVVEKGSRSMRQQLGDDFVVFVLFGLLIGYAMVLDVVAESAVGKQEKIIVILEEIYFY